MPDLGVTPVLGRAGVRKSDNLSASDGQEFWPGLWRQSEVVRSRVRSTDSVLKLSSKAHKDLAHNPPPQCSAGQLRRRFL